MWNSNFFFFLFEVRTAAAAGLPARRGVCPAAERHHEAPLLDLPRGVDHAVRVLRPVDTLLHLVGCHLRHGPRLAQQVCVIMTHGT